LETKIGYPYIPYVLFPLNKVVVKNLCLCSAVDTIGHLFINYLVLKIYSAISAKVPLQFLAVNYVFSPLYFLLSGNNYASAAAADVVHWTN